MKDQKIPVKILILPKFEVGELTGDFPGEAQYPLHSSHVVFQEAAIKTGIAAEVQFALDALEYLNSR